MIEWTTEKFRQALESPFEFVHKPYTTNDTAFTLSEWNPSEKCRILILYTGAAESTALAVQANLKLDFARSYKDIEVSCIDPWSYVSFPFDFSKQSSNQNKSGFLSRALIETASSDVMRNLFLQVAYQQNHRKFMEIFADFRPDAVISVHPLCQDILGKCLRKVEDVWKEQAKSFHYLNAPAHPVPFITIVTETSDRPHRLWFSDYSTVSLVPNLATYKYVTSELKLINPIAILGGIPLHPAFRKPYPPLPIASTVTDASSLPVLPPRIIHGRLHSFEAAIQYGSDSLWSAYNENDKSQVVSLRKFHPLASSSAASDTTRNAVISLADSIEQTLAQSLRLREFISKSSSTSAFSSPHTLSTDENDVTWLTQHSEEILLALKNEQCSHRVALGLRPDLPLVVIVGARDGKLLHNLDVILAGVCSELVKVLSRPVITSAQSTQNNNKDIDQSLNRPLNTPSRMGDSVDGIINKAATYSESFHNNSSTAPPNVNSTSSVSQPPEGSAGGFWWNLLSSMGISNTASPSSVPASGMALDASASGLASNQQLTHAVVSKTDSNIVATLNNELGIPRVQILLLLQSHKPPCNDANGLKAINLSGRSKLKMQSLQLNKTFHRDDDKLVKDLEQKKGRTTTADYIKGEYSDSTPTNQYKQNIQNTLNKVSSQSIDIVNTNQEKNNQPDDSNFVQQNSTTIKMDYESNIPSNSSPLGSNTVPFESHESSLPPAAASALPYDAKKSISKTPLQTSPLHEVNQGSHDLNGQYYSRSTAAAPIFSARMSTTNLPHTVQETQKENTELENCGACEFQAEDSNESEWQKQFQAYINNVETLREIKNLLERRHQAAVVAAANAAQSVTGASSTGGGAASMNGRSTSRNGSLIEKLPSIKRPSALEDYSLNKNASPTENDNAATSSSGMHLDRANSLRRLRGAGRFLLQPDSSPMHEGDVVSNAHTMDKIKSSSHSPTKSNALNNSNAAHFNYESVPKSPSVLSHTSISHHHHHIQHYSSNQSIRSNNKMVIVDDEAGLVASIGSASYSPIRENFPSAPNLKDAMDRINEEDDDDKRSAAASPLSRRPYIPALPLASISPPNAKNNDVVASNVETTPQSSSQLSVKNASNLNTQIANHVQNIQGILDAAVSWAKQETDKHLRPPSPRTLQLRADESEFGALATARPDVVHRRKLRREMIANRSRKVTVPSRLHLKILELDAGQDHEVETLLYKSDYSSSSPQHLQDNSLITEASSAISRLGPLACSKGLMASALRAADVVICEPSIQAIAEAVASCAPTVVVAIPSDRTSSFKSDEGKAVRPATFRDGSITSRFLSQIDFFGSLQAARLGAGGAGGLLGITERGFLSYASEKERFSIVCNTPEAAGEMVAKILLTFKGLALRQSMTLNTVRVARPNISTLIYPFVLAELQESKDFGESEKVIDDDPSPSEVI